VPSGGRIHGAQSGYVSSCGRGSRRSRRVENGVGRERVAMHVGRANHPLNRQDVNKCFGRGSDIVTGLIGGLAFGGGVGSALTGGPGLIPGAVVGALIGVVAGTRASRSNSE
jgi:hypothetical protein